MSSNDMEVDISAIAIRVSAIKIYQRIGSGRQARYRLIDNSYNPGLVFGDLREKLTKCCMRHIETFSGYKL